MHNRYPEVTVFRTTRAILGESLWWNSRAEAMLWCDITAGQLHFSPISGALDGSDDEVFDVPPPLASFAFATIEGNPGFVASLGDRVVLLGAHGGIRRELAAIEHSHSGMRLNEGKVDPFGRWVTGSMDLTTGDPDGAFYAITPAGEVSILAGGIGVANGLEWSEDGSRIWFTDTSVNTVYTGAYGEEGITDVEVFLDDGPHDGLTATTDGGFWGAHYGQGRIVHYDSAGSVLGEIALPAPNLTSVAFGGPDLATLYVASARENLTEEQLQQHPLSGAVFAVETGTRGRPPRSFTA